MNKTIFSKCIYVFLSLLLALGTFMALPGGVVNADLNQVYPAIVDGADRLVDLQNNDGGWDWPLDNGNPDTGSALNTLGPIAKGLAEAYNRTGFQEYQDALELAGTLLLSKTAFSSSDGYLAAQLDATFGVTTYTDYVTANFYDKLAAGTYNRNGTLYDTASYITLIRNNRSGAIANLAAWDVGMGLVGAALCGADTTEWIIGTKAEINEIDGGTTDAELYYDIIGLAGAVYGLAIVGEDFDPTAGDYASDSSLADLAESLAGYQLNSGGFTWNKNYLIENDANEDIQTTAYAILALNEVDRGLYLTNIQNAADYMISVQMDTGGWPEGGENNEVTAEALWGISVAYPVLPEVWVCETGDCGHPEASFNVIQDGVNNVALGGIVHVLAGTYTENLIINKPLTLSGESKTNVIIDPDSTGGYGIAATADGLVFENFTLQNAETFGLKISGSTNVVIQNVLVQASGNTNVDLNGVNHATLDAVESYNSSGGNGFSITDSNDITVSNSISEGNHFTTFSAGVMVAASGEYYPGGSNNIVFSNNDFREPTHIYTERANNDPDDGSDVPFAITNLDPGNYDYVLKTSLGLGESYYASFADAKAAAVLYADALLAGDLSSFSIKSVSLATFYVDSDLKIQTAVNAAEAGETVRVAAGTYVEDVVIDKALNVYGPNAGVNPNTDTRNPEAVILLEVPGDTIDYTLMWYLEADGITIDGFLFDGDNPALTSGLDVRGADVDAGSAIVSYEGIGNLRIQNNILKNFSYASIIMYNYYNSGTPTSENYIQNNWIDNLNPETWGIGIMVYNSFYADIQNNVITRGRVGIQTGNFQRPNPGSTANIKNNDIEATRLGLFYNLMSGTSTPFEVVDNNFTALPHANSQSGILISSINVAVQTNFQNNNITGFDYGINFWNAPTSNFVTVNGGVIDQCDYGVFANNYDGYSSNGNSSIVQIQDITIQNSTNAAVYVKDNELNTNAATIKLNVLSGNQLINNPVDFLIEGLDATMTLDETLTGPFVWNIDGALIQPALDETYAGDTFVILAGEYEQNFTVQKYLNIYGEGSGDDPAVDTIIKKLTNSAVVTISASGLSETEPLLLQDLRIEPVGVYGLNLGNLSYLKLDNVKVIGSADTDFNENESCLKVSTAADVKYLDVVDSAFDGCDYGWYVAKAVTADASNLQYVNVLNTTFNNNDYKGAYIEKLSDAVFENVSVFDNGSTGFWNNDWNAGIDVNLKNGDYQNLTFNNIIVDGNGLGYKEGTGLLVKARDDGATYGAFPATLDNVLITNSTFTGNERGIRLGEPGKLNAGPTNVVINFNRIFGNEQTYTGADGSVYGGLVNQSLATVSAENNWFGCNAGPGATDCDAVAVGTDAGVVNAEPWIVLSLTADPAALEPGMTADMEANLVMNSADVSTAADGYIPQGLLVSFTAPDGGSLNPTSGLTVNSAVATTFTPPEIHGDYEVCAAVDNELLCQIVPVVGPGAVDDVYTTPEDTTLVVAAPGVLENDANIESIRNAVALLVEAEHGLVTLNADGSFTYVPDTGFVGEDTFEYQVVTYPNDAKSSWTDEAIVTITVTPVNKVPVAVADAYDAVQNVTLEKTAAEGVLANDTDADTDDTLEAVLVNDVSNGTLTLNADGSFTYVPAVNYVGFDSFTYYATDGEANSAPVTVTITVAPGIPVTGDPIMIYLPLIVR